jgi:hypothetical protein
VLFKTCAKAVNIIVNLIPDTDGTSNVAVAWKCLYWWPRDIGFTALYFAFVKPFLGMSSQLVQRHFCFREHLKLVRPRQQQKTRDKNAKHESI